MKRQEMSPASNHRNGLGKQLFEGQQSYQGHNQEDPAEKRRVTV